MEIEMGDHINKKRDRSKHHKRGFNESQDIQSARRDRVSFKNYLQELEEELLELDMIQEDVDQVETPEE
jgi:hypothetical protein